MIRLKTSEFESVQALAQKIMPVLSETESVREQVEAIIEDVKREGDLALRKYNAKFGCQKAQAANAEFLKPLRVEKEVFENALKTLDPALKIAIERAAENIRNFHSRQVESDWMMDGPEGSQLGMLIRPIERVALYVPGGTAAYPSTVLMNAIPAQLAGVSSLLIMTPAGAEGEVHKVVLATAALLGIDEVYRVGGAQAVAAAAYGTESILKADKIVGPGNKYVAAAKQKVYGLLDIDMVAGPSEIMIVADEEANPAFVAADLLAQAEHDVDARMILVTPDSALIEKVERELALQKRKLPRQDILNQSLSQNCWAIEVPCLQTAFDVANAVAPEHLEILTRQPEQWLPKIRHAGSVFLGPYAPEALGDYYAGTNHTLPTGGTARFSSPLGVYDFIKRTSVTAYTAKALGVGASNIMTLAEAEGLMAHRQAIAVRKGYDEPFKANRRLSANENPWGLQETLPATWRRDIFPQVCANRYPDSTYENLRAALSDYVHMPADSIVCGNGSDELIRLLIECYTTEKGGGVLTPGPTFGEYAKAAAHKGTRYRELPPLEKYAMNLMALKKALDEDPPEILFICNPNNPTGEVLAVEQILSLCDATQALVVVDEAYGEFGGETVVPEIEKRANLVVLKTLSKAFGMAGLRVGYGIGPADITQELNQRRMPYNVNVVAEAAAIAALSKRELVLEKCKILREERTRLYLEMAAQPSLRVYPSSGNFILFEVAEMKKNKVLSALNTAGIEIRAYEDHEILRGCFRVSVGQATDNQAFLQTLKAELTDQGGDDR